MQFDSLKFIGWLLLAGSAVGCVYLCYASLAIRRFTKRRHPQFLGATPVSILKPLCGKDADLYENLKSFCAQDYPAWQIVFGVQDPRDPAIPIVHRLVEKCPQVDISLVVDGLGHGGNLKVANLQNMLPSASHELIVMADSDMRVTQNYLAEVTAPLRDPAIGLVTCLYRGLPAGGVWSKLACAYINHGFLPQAVVAEEIGVGAGCFGATIAMRRDTLVAIGGFATIRDALADDHALGAAVRRAGLKVELSPYLVDNIIVEPSLSALFRHELRWARTIRVIAPAGFVASVVTQPIVLALAAVAVGTLPWEVAIAVLGTALACRALTVHLTDRCLRLRNTPLWLMPFRDMLSFAVFVASFFSRTVAWRDRTFRIGKNGQMILDGDKPA